MKTNLRRSAAVAILAVIGGIGAAHAQPSSGAAFYPPGPTGQGGTTTTSNVNVVNVPTVTIGNTPTVAVGNEVAIKELRTPIAFKLNATLQPGVEYASSSTAFNVPAGQRLTIENFSFYCNGPSEYVHVGLYASDLSGSVNVMSSAPLPWLGSDYRVVGNAALHVSSDGPQVYAGFDRNTLTGTTGCWGSVIGYLTAIP